ncbi:MAG: DnaJ domain-containing protein [Bryobacteraceae bacterium]
MDRTTEQYYAVLNLEPTATPEDVTQAYQDLLRVWDPERFSHSPRLEMKAEEKVKEIIEAYRALVQRGAAASGLETGSGAAPSEAPFQAGDSAMLPQAAPEAFPGSGAPPPPWAYIAAATPAATAGPSVPAPGVELAHSEPARPLHPAGPAGLPGSGQWEPGVPVTPSAPQRRLPAAAVVIGAAIIAGGLLGAGALLFEIVTGGAAARRVASVSPVSSPDQEAAANLPPAEPARPIGTAARGARRAAAPEAKPLETGAELALPRGRRGVGRFRVVNSGVQDAVVRVVEQGSPEEALRLVYVKAGTEVMIDGIGSGVYLVSFSPGPVSKKPRSFGAPLGPFQFVHVQTDSGLQSDEYRLVIKP